MKYQQKDFDEKLKGEIKEIEMALEDHIAILLSQNKSVFAKKNLDFDADFDKIGTDPFNPGYSSTVSIGITEKGGELIEFQIIKIWECERSFLGVPISKNIIGSKINGELLDETFEEVKQELKEYIDEVLQVVN